MSSSEFNYDLHSDSHRSALRKEYIEPGFTGKLQNLKNEYRLDIRDLSALGINFRETLEALNRVRPVDVSFRDCFIFQPLFQTCQLKVIRKHFTQNDLRFAYKKDFLNNTRVK